MPNMVSLVLLRPTWNSYRTIDCFIAGSCGNAAPVFFNKKSEMVHDVAAGKNRVSSIILFIAAIGIAVRFFGTFLQLAASLVKALEKGRTPGKEES